MPLFSSCDGPQLFSVVWWVPGLGFINLERLKNLITWSGSGVSSGPRPDQLLSTGAQHCPWQRGLAAVSGSSEVMPAPS